MVGTPDQLHSAHPGGGREAGDIGDGTAAESDHHVPPVETDLPEHVPAEAEHGEVLGVLGVRHLQQVCVDTGVGERVPDHFGGGDQRRRVDQRDPGSAGGRRGKDQLVEQTAADDDVVRGSGLDPHRHRCWPGGAEVWFGRQARTGNCFTH